MPLRTAMGGQRRVAARGALCEQRGGRNFADLRRRGRRRRGTHHHRRTGDCGQSHACNSAVESEAESHCQGYPSEQPPKFSAPFARIARLVFTKRPLSGPTSRGSPPPFQREALVQRYLSVDCIDPHRLAKQRIVVDERAVFRQRDHRKHQGALFVSSGKGLADLGRPIGGRCHISHNYLTR
jgi:hypothetical protein